MTPRQRTFIRRLMAERAGAGEFLANLLERHQVDEPPIGGGIDDLNDEQVEELIDGLKLLPKAERTGLPDLNKE